MALWKPGIRLKRLEKSFYTRPNVQLIAKQLLGKVLCTRLDGMVTKGMIVETEAYSFRERGCHAFANKMTKRNAIMFEDGGVAYVYLCYGVHEMMNIVTNVAEKADAVLIRALEPLQGLDGMILRTGAHSPRRLTSGPGKLTAAMGIDRTFNGASLLKRQVWVEDHGIKIAKQSLVSATRIGIDYAGADALLPWRFYVRGNPWVSKT